MRAVAVLAVFANHLFDWPPGGFVGVDVFFVLSGFFITGLLIRERTATGALSFRNFYLRRVKRILPSALLVLIATVAGAFALFPETRARSTLLDALYAAVFASNFRFQAVGADYFRQGQPPSPVQHYWSLSIEEQFYFVWPGLIVLIFAAIGGLRRRGVDLPGQWGLFGVMAVMVAGSFTWAVYLSVHDPVSAYFSSLARVWELGVGALLAIAGPLVARIGRDFRPMLAYAGLAGVGASLFLVNPTVRFPAPWAALPVLATALVVAAFHGSPVRSVALLTNPVARWFGDTSYTLYLWHWPVVIMLQSLLAKGPLFYLLAIVLVLGLTAATYRFYESPIRESDWLTDVRPDRWLTPRMWGMAGVAAAVAVVVSLSVMTYTTPSWQAQKVAAAALPPGTPVGACFGAPAMVTPGCVLRDPDVPLRPPVDLYADDNAEAEVGDCYRVAREGEDAGPMKPCEYGHSGPDAKRIAFVGDSHALAMLPALWPILDRNKWRLTTYLGSKCLLSDPAPVLCEPVLGPVRAELAAKKYDLVLTTNFDKGFPVDQYRKAWAPLLAAGTRVAVIADNPRTSPDAMSCLMRFTFGRDKTGECGVPRAAAFPPEEDLVAAAEGLPGVSTIDFTRFYCDDDWCPSVIGNVIVYRDVNGAGNNSHITQTFARTLAPALEEELCRALAGGRP